MPISTNFNVFPYGDDYNENKQYYKMLFKPNGSVQVRELNQLQTMLQRQIETFGDNILKKGTIVSGCNFIFNNSLSYAKILDNDIDGFVVIPSNLVGAYTLNSLNLRAQIVNFADGYESSNPNLKTIYLKYLNSGNDGVTKRYIGGETLTVFDFNNSIRKIYVNNGGYNISNNDPVIFTSAVSASLTNGRFSNGDFICSSAVGGVANLEIIEADYNSLSSINQVLLKIKPQTAYLIDPTKNKNYWTLSVNTPIKSPDNSITGVITKVFGSGAQAKAITDSSGVIQEIPIIINGKDYDYVPHVSIRSLNNQNGLFSVSLKAQNYITQVKISNEISSVGEGSSFSITDGYIYQKGYFQKIFGQTVIVDRYSSKPNNMVAGFITEEKIITSNQDTTLLDTMGDNEGGEGADRLKLVPKLVISTKEKANSNPDFFSIVEWNNGNPVKQNQTTVYNTLGDEIAKRNHEQTGNFVIKRFGVTTSQTENGKKFVVSVSPGKAYINGYRVETTNTTNISLDKGLETKKQHSYFNIYYGNYIKINEMVGNFQFNVGAQIELYDTYRYSITKKLNSTITPVGKRIGYAKIRSLLIDQGLPGTPNAVYNLYVFDIKLDSGQNINNIKSLYYPGVGGTNRGIADVVLVNNNPINETNKDGLIFKVGTESLKNSNNTSYVYRTLDQNIKISNGGILTKTIASSANEFFEFTGIASSSQLRDFHIVPTQNDLIQYSSLTGNVSVNTTTTVVTGTGTTFLTQFQAGDYICVNTGVTEDKRRIVKISSQTSLEVDSVFTTTNTTSKFTRVYPMNIPIPFGYRTGLSGNVDNTSKNLTLNFKDYSDNQITFRGANDTTSLLGYNVSRQNVISSTKTANRKKFIKIRLSNDPGKTSGPWCLGISDVFRLRKVYVATGDNFSNNLSTNPEITDKFYIDHNQNINYLGFSWLYLKPNAKYILKSTEVLLIEFDYFTRDSEGYFDVVSYRRTNDSNTISQLDSTNIDQLGVSASTYEIPEIYTYNGKYIDLIDNFDFRPSVKANITPSSNHQTAPYLTSSVETLNTSLDKKFPCPGKVCRSYVESYLGRIDELFIKDNGDVFILNGVYDANPKNVYQPSKQENCIKLQTLFIPSYPSIPKNLSFGLNQVIKTNVYNENALNNRLTNHTVVELLNASEIEKEQPIVYTMKDIGDINKRLQNVEKYISLSILEKDLANKNISSSLNAENRFKFGFFVDDFSNNDYTDLNNPNYAAGVQVNE